MNGFLTGALSGLESYRALAGAFAWSGVSYLVVCSALAWLAGLNGAIVGIALSGMIQFILLAAALRRECLLQRIKTRYDSFAQERKVILKFTLPAGLIGFTSGPALWLPSAFLIRQPNGYSQMAIYGASFSLMAVVLFLPGIANAVGTSIINYHKGADNRTEFNRAFWANLAVTAATIVCGAGLFALLGPQLLRLWKKFQRWLLSFAHPAFVDRAARAGIGHDSDRSDPQQALAVFPGCRSTPRHVDPFPGVLTYPGIRGARTRHRVRDGVDGRIVSHRDYRVSPRI